MEQFGTVTTGIDTSQFITKVTGATGNVPIFNATGGLDNSSVKLSGITGASSLTTFGSKFYYNGFEFTESNIAFIDKTNGNDITGEFGNPNKPFQTIKSGATVAYAEYNNLASGLTTPIMVYVKTGVYEEFDILFPEIHYYFEYKAIVTNDGSGTAKLIGSDWKFGVKEGNYYVYGMGEFLCRNDNVEFLFAGKSIVYMEGVFTNSIWLWFDAGGATQLHCKNFKFGGRIYHQVTNTSTGRHLMRFDNCHFLNGQQEDDGGNRMGYSSMIFNDCKFYALEKYTTSGGGYDLYDIDGNLLASRASLRNFINTLNTGQTAIDATINGTSNRTACFEVLCNSTIQSRRYYEFNNSEFIIEVPYIIGFHLQQTIDIPTSDVFKLNGPIFTDISTTGTTTAMVLKKNTESHRDVYIEVNNDQNSNCDTLYGIPTSLTRVRPEHEHRIRRFYNVSGAPTVNDDYKDGFLDGYLWVDNSGGQAYIMISGTTGAAGWKQLT